MPNTEQANTAPNETTNTTVDPLELLSIAVRVAEVAAHHVRTRRPEVFGGVGAHRLADAPDSVQSKSTPTDPVTVVDTETEQVARTLLGELRPHDAILGEEGGGSESMAGVRWVIDPIDGTVNFLYGIPAYAVSVAAQVDGHSVAGAVVDVAREFTYAAALGHGATRTDSAGATAELRCNDVDSVDFALVATGFGYGSRRREEQGALIAKLLPQIRDIRRIGSAALDLCMVAAGLVDAHFEHGLSPWDWAAGALIASEAGARVHVPSADTMSDAGEVTLAVAPGIADDFVVLLTQLDAYRAIPND